MIRVTVELVSAIDASRSRLLGVALISNDGTGTAAQGSYNAVFSKSEPYITREVAEGLRTAHVISKKNAWKMGRISGFDKVHFGAWDLLFLSLASAIGEVRGKRLLASTKTEAVDQAAQKEGV